MKKVKDNSAVPRGGTFIYKHDNGYEQRHPYFDQLKKMVVDYKHANNLPIGLQFDEQFEEELCRNAAASTCEEFLPPSLLEKMSTLAQALYKSARTGFKTVTAEEFDARLSICGACNFFSGKTGIMAVACAKCGCSAKKLQLASESCPIGKWNEV